MYWTKPIHRSTIFADDKHVQLSLRCYPLLRPHRLDDEEFCRMLAGEVIDDAKLFNTNLTEWERFYNFARPNGFLGGLTPYERLRQLTRP